MLLCSRVFPLFPIQKPPKTGWPTSSMDGIGQAGEWGSETRKGSISKGCVTCHCGLWSLIPLRNSGNHCRKHTSELSHPRGKEAHSSSHQSLVEGFVCVLLYLRIKQKVFRQRSRCWEMEVRPACTETEGVGRVWTGPQQLLLHPTRYLCSSPPLFRESRWNGHPGCQSRALVIVWDQAIRKVLPTGCPDMMGPPKDCDIGP